MLVNRIVLLLTLLFLLVPSTAKAGFGFGAFLDPGLVSYEGLNAGSLSRETITRPTAFVGIHYVKPVFSGVFLSVRGGPGFTLDHSESQTLPTGNKQEVSTDLSLFRAGARLNLLADNRLFVFAGGGYQWMRLRFTGTIPGMNADTRNPFYEAGFGRMLSDEHFVMLSAAFTQDAQTYTIGYTWFFHYYGY